MDILISKINSIKQIKIIIVNNFVCKCVNPDQKLVIKLTIVLYTALSEVSTGKLLFFKFRICQTDIII